jgi:hypothetical protein
MSPTPPLKIIIIRETPAYVEWVWSYGSPGSWSGRPSRDRKMLCIGGPFGGQRKARPQLDGMGYVGYNAAQSRRGAITRKPYHPKATYKPYHPKALWVHNSLL